VEGRVDIEQITEFLERRFGRDVGNVSLVGQQGEWSEAYAFDCAGIGYIARFSALLEDFAKDRLAARYASRDLPIPRVAEVGEAFGGYYAISERASGGYIDVIDEAQMRTMLPSLFAALDAARLADLSEFAGYGTWGADGIAPHPTWRAALLHAANDPPTERTHGWREKLAGSPTGAGPFEEAFEALRALVDY
jgi:hygromycin-B 4-O-kinase